MRRKLFSNKKGIEIAVNYIVAFVLGVVTLSLGFVIIKAFVAGGDQSITYTSEQLNAKVSDLLCDQTDIICFSDNNQQIHRNEYAFVGLHIKNIQNTDISVTISVDPTDTTATKFYPADPSQSFDPTHMKLQPLSQTITIKPKDTQKVGFALYAAKNANKGTYSFLVTVSDANGNGNNANLFGTMKDRVIVQII